MSDKPQTDDNGHEWDGANWVKRAPAAAAPTELSVGARVVRIDGGCHGVIESLGNDGVATVKWDGGNQEVLDVSLVAREVSAG